MNGWQRANRCEGSARRWRCTSARGRRLASAALAIVVMATVLASCEQAPIDFTANRTSGPDPLIVRFTGQSQGAVSWQWSFGDGATSTERVALHTYTAPGVYTVTLTATDSGGENRTATKTDLITVSPTVNPPLQGDFGEVVADCPFSHRASDDPLVHPGMPGMSHSHDFFGNTSTDDASNIFTLWEGGTTCDPAADKAAYWVPTMFHDGAPVDVEKATLYYFNNNAEAGALRSFPLGLSMVAGSSGRQGPGGASPYVWSCLSGTGAASDGDFTDCGPGGKIELLLDFPSCWNGTDLDSPDHQSHMAYPDDGTCPSTHPVPVPALQFKLRWDHRGGPGTSIASGNGYSAHGDFINVWDPVELDRRVEDCLHVRIKCGPDGLPS